MANDKSIFSMYLNDLSKVPLLSREEEAKLAALAAKGDKRAKDRLVTANLRFVVKVAKEYQNRGLELDDLVNEGNIGLMTAVEKFDPERGFHFISYAIWWIRQGILKAIAEKSRAIRLPMNKATDLAKIENVRKQIHEKKSELEEINEIASKLNLEDSYVREMLSLSRGTISLDAALDSEDSSSDSLVAQIASSTAESPDTQLIKESMHNDIETVLNTLKPSEKKVICLRYGLNGRKPMSLKEVGDEISLTKERVRQIEKNAIARMKLPTRSRYLESYVA